jgi:hypothetical protein
MSVLTQARVLPVISILLFALGLTVLAANSAPARSTGAARPQTVWTVASARQEAFRTPAPKPQLTGLSNYDPDRDANIAAIQSGRLNQLGRQLTLYPDRTYKVAKVVKGVPMGFYYAINGGMYAFHVETGKGYPKKAYKYAYGAGWESQGYKHGDLLSVALEVAPANTYVFDPTTKELINHWINKKCYDASGASCGTRK